MTPDRLREIIAGGESLDVEFKGKEAHPLSDGELVEAVVCLANRPGERPGWLLGLDELLVLRAAVEEPLLTLQRARAITQTDPASVAAVVDRLSDRALLDRTSGTERFTLAESVRQRLRLPQPDRRRVRGTLDPIEAAILDHVARHGRVTRAEVAAAHALGADQAKRVLSGMVARGLLQRRRLRPRRQLQDTCGQRTPFPSPQLVGATTARGVPGGATGAAAAGPVRLPVPPDFKERDAGDSRRRGRI